jgi:hypothetical protein
MQIRIKRGRTKRWIVTVKVNGVPRDISGDGFWFTVKTRYSDADAAALFQLTNGNGISKYDAPNGKILISVDPADTAGCPSQRTVYQYDLTMQYPTGETYTVSEGPFAVEPDITNSTVSNTW